MLSCLRRDFARSESGAAVSEYFEMMLASIEKYLLSDIEHQHDMRDRCSVRDFDIRICYNNSDNKIDRNDIL